MVVKKTENLISLSEAGEKHIAVELEFPKD
jgi:hypothetical protein